MLENTELINEVFDEFKPERVVHLAAQAGVRYSLENPRAYIDSNVIGTFNVMEGARRLGGPFANGIYVLGVRCQRGDAF